MTDFSQDFPAHDNEITISAEVAAKLLPPRKRYVFSDRIMKVKRLNEHATLPARSSKNAAGYDLFCAEQIIKLPAKGKVIVDTAIAIAIPEGHYGRVAPRSGLATKHFITTGAGVIDADYRGPLGVVLFNHSDVDFLIERGDRVAQLIIEKIATPEIEEVDELDDTERGAGGFGSTGNK